jgi:hypothetical protein
MFGVLGEDDAETLVRLLGRVAEALNSPSMPVCAAASLHSAKDES